MGLPSPISDDRPLLLSRRLVVGLVLFLLLVDLQPVEGRVCQAGKTSDNNVLNVASRWLTIYKSLTFPCDGSLVKWEFFVSDPDESALLYLDIWRPVADSADSYFLVGSSEIRRMSSAGKQLYQLTQAERITVKAGDMVGLHYSRAGDYATVPIFTEQLPGSFEASELSDVVTAELYDDDIRTLMTTAGRVTIAPVIAESAIPAVIGFTEETGSSCNIGPAGLPTTTNDLTDPRRWMAICPQVQFSCSGQILYWEFLSLRASPLPLFLAVFRPAGTPSSKYQLVGMTQVVVNKTGLVRVSPTGYDRFWVEAGDSYGFFYSNGAELEDGGIIPYADQAKLNGFSYGDIADCISLPVLAATVEDQLTNLGAIDTSIGQPVRRAYAIRAYLAGKRDDTCGDVPTIGNATAQVSFSNRDSRIGDVVQYTCLPGYELSGSPIVSCDASAAWSELPSCKLISTQQPCSVGAPKISTSAKGSAQPGTWLNLCLVPGLSSRCFGSIAAWEMFSVAQGGNSSVYLSVWRKTGYSTFQLIGNNSVTVSKYGQVAFTVPEKERITIRSGDYFGIFYDGPDSEAVVNYASEQALMGFAVEDLWDCVSIPVYRQQIQDALSEDSRIMTNQAVPVKRLFNLRARILGTKSCGVAPDVTNATQIGASFVGRSTAGDTVTYGCMPGLYLQSGELTVTCQTSGTWSTFPVCTTPPVCAAGPRGLPLISNVALPRPGNWLNVCPTSSFACNGKISQWEFYSTRADDRMIYLTVWRRDGPNSAALVGYDTWNATKIGIVQVASQQTINVMTGDFIGVLYDDDDRFGVIPFADQQHLVAGVGQNDLQECYSFKMTANQAIAARGVSFGKATAARRLHLLKAYVTVDTRSTETRAASFRNHQFAGSCADIPVIQNGYPAIVDSTQPFTNSPGNGDRVIFKCRVGFVLAGNATVTCQSDGTWTPLPLCQELPSCTLGVDDLQALMGKNLGTMRAPGGWMNICPGSQFPCGGRITHWTFMALAQSNATVFLGVFRRLDARMQLVGYNSLRAYTAGLVEYEVPIDQQVTVTQGDFVGIFYSETQASGAIPYADANSVSAVGSVFKQDDLVECFSLPMNSVTLFQTLLVNKFLSPNYYVLTKRLYLVKAYVKAEASCGAAPSVAHASTAASFHDRLSTPGDTVAYRCATGMTLRGSALISCEQSGRWSDMPECLG